MDKDARVESLERDVLTLKSELAVLRANYASKQDLAQSEIATTKWVALVVGIVFVVAIIAGFPN
ncbi:hypothetical protein ACEN9F_16750 [Duganella sp. CT11-25]|uniref:hypothetical protein n=1 Tax=unclassified Duganella TaxID=2636909 RepID=UPI0039AF2844